MYEHFNPLGLGGAWWQHILLLIIAAILGYIIGYISSRSAKGALEAELDSLSGDLNDCLKSKRSAPAPATVATPVVAAASVAAAAFVAPKPAVSGKPDDLKVVEGIGPKIEQLFHNAGIKTFVALSETHPDRLTEILRAAGPRYQMHNPETWPKQARMAADGKFEELKAWQDELNKGRLS